MERGSFSPCGLFHGAWERSGKVPNQVVTWIGSGKAAYHRCAVLLLTRWIAFSRAIPRPEAKFMDSLLAV
ncbi:MAG: hypothetical protein CMI11_02335 [Oceanospirillales bacterium]|nr:hypothetical protein [Oceanospirillales bacterium]